MAQTLGITLPLQLENNGYFGTTKQLLRVLRSNLKNLIMTRKGERLHQPTFGCDIWNFIFEPNVPDTVQNAYASVVSAVEIWMPFLEIVNVDLENTTDDNINNNRIQMKILFRLRSNQNIQELLTLQL
jgi:phage baseplate assembly protein W